MKGDRRWDDTICGKYLHFICQKKAWTSLETALLSNILRFIWTVLFKANSNQMTSGTLQCKAWIYRKVFPCAVFNSNKIVVQLFLFVFICRVRTHHVCSSIWKTRASVSLGFQTPKNRWKRPSAFIVFECLETQWNTKPEFFLITSPTNTIRTFAV